MLAKAILNSVLKLSSMQAIFAGHDFEQWYSPPLKMLVWYSN